MKHVTLYMVFAIAVHSLCCADETKLSAEVRKVLQDSSRFHEVHLTKNLPSAIVGQPLAIASINASGIPSECDALTNKVSD